MSFLELCVLNYFLIPIKFIITRKHDALKITVLLHAILNKILWNFAMAKRRCIKLSIGTFSYAPRRFRHTTERHFNDFGKWCFNQAYKYFFYLGILILADFWSNVKSFLFLGINSTTTYVHTFVIIIICLFMFLIVCKLFAHKEITWT